MGYAIHSLNHGTSPGDFRARSFSRRQSLKLSIIIPVVNERVELPRALESLSDWMPRHEVIVVDGGSTDGTREWLRRRQGIMVVDALTGRGTQMNAGARVASGDVLLFLHADCHLPGDAVPLIENALVNPAVLGGGFLVRFAEERPRKLKVVAGGINFRTRLTNTATGDQAIFVRRTAFQELDGYSDWPLFEDVDLVTRIRRCGQFAVVPGRVTISPRRWLNLGVWRTMLLMFALRFGFYAGISPFKLHRWFQDVRPHLKAN